MNKQEVVGEFKGILSLVKTLVEAYSRKEVTIHVYADKDGDVTKEANRMEQHLNFLSEFGLVTTMQRAYDNQKFTIGLNLNILILYMNHYDDIDYILSANPDHYCDYTGNCIKKLNKMFKAIDARNHCEKCCDYNDREEVLE